MKFDWDQAKDEQTFKERGLRFQQATALWDDPQAIELATDTAHETRILKIGMLPDSKLYTAVFTPRDDLIRIISFRRSRDKEVSVYENAKDIS